MARNSRKPIRFAFGLTSDIVSCSIIAAMRRIRYICTGTLLSWLTSEAPKCLEYLKTLWWFGLNPSWK